MIANLSQADPADSRGDILETAPLSGLAGQPLGVAQASLRAGCRAFVGKQSGNAPCFLR